MTDGMRKGVGRGISRERAKQAIDLLLVDRSDEFKAVVFELCREMGWPDDEPSFLFAIMTKQLETLVRQYPERISEAMATAARELEQDWQKIQAQLSVAAIEHNQVLTGMTTTLTDAQLAMDDQLEGARQLLADERLAMLAAVDDRCQQALTVLVDERLAMVQVIRAECEAMVQRSQLLTEQQKQVLEKQTKRLIAEGVMSWRDQADEQIKQIVRRTRAAHFWQTMGFACCSAISLVVVALAVEGRADRLSDWGRFESWNQDQVEACRAVDRATCNIHIKQPD